MLLYRSSFLRGFNKTDLTRVIQRFSSTLHLKPTSNKKRIKASSRRICDGGIHKEYCLIQPIFGNAKDNIVRSCYKHKRKDDIDLVSKKCDGGINGEICTKRATFGPKYGTKRSCAKHKRKNDVYLYGYKCDGGEFNEICHKTASYGLLTDFKRRTCAQHKRKNYVNLAIKFCIHNDCYQAAIYGKAKDGIKLYCKQHKQANHVQLTGKNLFKM